MFGTYSLPLMKGTDLFPAVTQPPATVQIIIRDELDLWHDYQQDMIDAGQKLVRENIGAIAGFFRGQRQNQSLSIAPSSQTRMSWPQIETVYTAMPGGQEHLKIFVDPAVDVLKKIDQLDPLCLLILYGGNKVAAVRMDTISGGAPIYTRTLKDSTWGSERLKTIQVKLEKAFSVVFAPFNVTKNIISTTDKYNLTTVAPAVALKSFATSSLVKEYDPVINGGGGTYFTPFETYAASAKEVTQTDSYADIGVTPYAISSTGEFYYGLDARGAGNALTVELFSELVAYSNVLPFSSGLPTVTSDLRDASWLGIPVYGGYAEVFYSTKTQFFQSREYSTDSAYIGPLGASLNAPFMFYRKDGQLDHLDITFSQLRYHVDVSFEDGITPPTDVYEASFLGYTISKTYADFAEYGRGLQGIFPFPPALSASKRYILAMPKPALNAADYITPYGTFSTTFADSEPKNQSAVRPWLHLSNGKRTLQGFVVNGKYYAYLDEKVWTPKKISLSDVQTMIMDVPLSRIKEFK